MTAADPRGTGTLNVPEDQLAEAAEGLGAEFAAFDVGVCETWDGPALSAQRRDRTKPGLTAVITGDPDEMRAALEEDSPPGTGGAVPAGG